LIRFLPVHGEQLWISFARRAAARCDGRGDGLRGHDRGRHAAEARRRPKLIRAGEAALENLRLKSEFLANMSHEIRHAHERIIGHDRPWRSETELTHDQREYLTAARRLGRRAARRDQRILDFSKIEAGKMRMEAVGFPLRDTLKTTVRTLAVRARQKNLTLSMDMPADVPCMSLATRDGCGRCAATCSGNCGQVHRRRAR